MIADNVKYTRYVTMTATAKKKTSLDLGTVEELFEVMHLSRECMSNVDSCSGENMLQIYGSIGGIKYVCVFAKHEWDS